MTAAAIVKTDWTSKRQSRDPDWGLWLEGRNLLAKNDGHKTTHDTDYVSKEMIKIPTADSTCVSIEVLFSLKGFSESRPFILGNWRTKDDGHDEVDVESG